MPLHDRIAVGIRRYRLEEFFGKEQSQDLDRLTNGMSTDGCRQGVVRSIWGGGALVCNG